MAHKYSQGATSLSHPWTELLEVTQFSIEFVRVGNELSNVIPVKIADEHEGFTGEFIYTQ
jgi:hypothetical protein